MATPAATQAPDGLDLGGQAELKAVLSKGFVLRASRSEHCMLSIQLAADKATAKKLKLGKKAAVIGKLTRAIDDSATLKVKLTVKAKRALKNARSVKLSLPAVAKDDAATPSRRS